MNEMPKQNQINAKPTSKQSTNRADKQLRDVLSNWIDFQCDPSFGNLQSKRRNEKNGEVTNWFRLTFFGGLHRFCLNSSVFRQAGLFGSGWITHFVNQRKKHIKDCWPILRFSAKQRNWNDTNFWKTLWFGLLQSRWTCYCFYRL